ncbi:ATP-dependent exoDNAse (exonuclease V) beta subunit [Rhizobium sp. BK049]|uniref:UvrD-helicase domain-containing protein n=1 Tax=Rhizobium sp. BK049 TaxID=2587095 RepID=UPI00161DB631|nr:UvrD-helicase domain-containing protein [Rhizobium sp. BK049]MBB3355569.1 ATP-dependent exoDNAse (exonuclease V) beta subunit [Rhizobium sp. BK049]
MRRLNTITAAAGAGKTTRIVADIAREVTTRAPEEILATTFTIKAADELVERARAKLFEGGNSEAAASLLGARFGTVNAVCGQIVNDFAIDLGRSPSTSVIGEGNEALVFSVAADAAIAAKAGVLNPLAERFGYNDPRRPDSGEPPDWRRTVRAIVTLARANGLDAEGLLASAERSVESYRALLPLPAADGTALDAGLAAALAAAVAARPAQPSKTAADHLPTIRAAHERASRGEVLNWSMWARLTKVACARTKDGPAYAEALAKLVAAAGHVDHPRLRVETEQFIRETFTCAAEALTAYHNWKAERGLLDFTDQEALALEVLKDPVRVGRLRERVGRVFVDEFQDSSPLQLAVFTALAEVAEESTWVGDPKQAIYGFRGADTELTQAAFTGAGAAANPQDVLSTSWRSRPGVIELSNALFTPAFERMGLPAAQHAFSGAARSDVGFDRPPTAWWPLLGKVDEQAQALAEGIRQCLEDASAWMVEGASREHRPLRSGDIAVLCRTNTDVARFARALSRVGLPVAVERSGLARTPHIELVLAACRWVADATDRLALAELARFFGSDPESDVWLSAAAAEDSVGALRARVPVAAELEGIREGVLNLTPAELVDSVIALPAMMAQIEQWGDPAIRFDDLEALRGFAAAYEGECAASGTPATLQGLLLSLDGADPKRPPSLAKDAIKVMTYHGAKGLEWPMTVLTGLAWEPKARLFEPVAEVDGELDWRAPLERRWIRFWPWPYGQSGKDSALEVAAFTSELGQAAWRRAVHEDIRLLYVGVTRARDYVVFAPPAKGTLNWLKLLDEPDCAPHVVPPPMDDNLLTVGDRTFVADVRPLAANGAAEERCPQPPFVRPRSVPVERPPLYLRPSQAEGGDWRVVERVNLGGRLPIDGVADMAALGEALHAIIAYDDVSRDMEQRLADADATLARWGVKGFAAVDALTASDRLSAWLGTRWPHGNLLHETPVTARFGDQLVQGRIDLLVDFDQGSAIVDHKSFPGRVDQWEGHAIRHAPQLGLYGKAVALLSGRPCNELWIHMPVVGALLRVVRTE